MNRHKNYEPTKKLWTITKLMSTTKIINRRKNNEPSQKLWAITKFMYHHKFMNLSKITNLHNYEPSQKLWTTTKTVFVLVHNFCDGSLFLWWLIIFVVLLSNFFWLFVTFAVVHDFVTVHIFLTFHNFRDCYTISFVIAHYFCDCFLHFVMVHACDRESEGWTFWGGRVGHVLP